MSYGRCVNGFLLYTNASNKCLDGCSTLLDLAKAFNMSTVGLYKLPMGFHKYLPPVMGLL